MAKSTYTTPSTQGMPAKNDFSLEAVVAYMTELGWTVGDLIQRLELRGSRIDRCLAGEAPFPKSVVEVLRSEARQLRLAKRHTRASGTSKRRPTKNATRRSRNPRGRT
jgi:hypothetical protein